MNASQYIENMNYLNDPRSQGKAKEPILLVENEDGEYDEVKLPTKFEVCDLCEGRGKHVNPSIDCGGISAHMFDDEDFAENYNAGQYDIPCNRCEGLRVVQAVDWDAMPKEQAAEYEAQLKEEADSRAENLAELRMGA
tara:strand:- start:40502 stop:40915 length:414 start_codon:yes stop_codon:yes gene_type:complete